MAAEEGDIITFIFTGVEGEVIPQNATRFIAHESAKIIPELLFYKHQNIVELICHAGVEKIEYKAFFICPRLRRLIIPGVKIVEGYALYLCEAVTDIECPNLERIGNWAFYNCKSLSNINLPSAKVVERLAFESCRAMTDVKFSKSLESIGSCAFYKCRSLERITISLKDGLFAEDNIFKGCRNLKSVDLVEGAELRETITAFLLEEWRNDTNEEIESINQILPNTPAGGGYDAGGKALAIREWSRSVLRKIIHYKAQHRQPLREAATSLKHVLPNDIVKNNVLPFLELPLHTFEGEDHEEDDDTDESHDTSDGGNDNGDERELHYASLVGGYHEEEENNEVRKRRKTTNDDY